MSRMVVALGGNALGETPLEQREIVQHTAKQIVDFIEEGHEVILAHGNGPQVGMINLAFENSAQCQGQTPKMPFPECGAMSQGYIGYHLQNGIKEELNNRGIDKAVTSVVSQVIVDKDDNAFKNPTKPIGSFYSKTEAKKLEKEGYDFIEDSGRGYRRVVPSPMPVDIVEKDVISTLVENEHILIACGGGGVPVVRENGSLKGVSAVIDKDFASEKLAEILEVDLFLILTAVEKVAINFGTTNEEWLSKMDIKTAKRYCQEGHFAPGSMLPKVKAAIKFAESKKDRKALITSLDKSKEALLGQTGTIIYDD
ncbi:carbamate kinase [Halobacteroides halobius DSM 5150]|uniref:Carbamate kinase n=1 Tax=Halobacteroides halobius (strain ATCC 35273 / DSM 5150 / MD-1) TaxID=748449 RepID=L0K9I4_HALHC|nr:carbamate kinase [Halobacteroides halobius]AGB41024.1 carbamate kinase [Halobacteroides halobius DSM 5150]